MRELPTHLVNEIRAVEFEYSTIPREILEKDTHLTDVLREISLLPKFEVATLIDSRQKNKPSEVQLPIQLIFAGGTCLTKAHGLIDRMSEDIDFKVHLLEVPQGYKVGQLTSIESRLRKLHKEIEKRLESIGFTFEEMDLPAKNPLVRDARSHYELSIDYASDSQIESTNIGALRPKLKLEIMASLGPLPHETRPIGYLHRKLIGLTDDGSFELACIDLSTTLAEKVLSFLRRHAWLWSGNQRGAFDEALVRHVYDVSQLTTRHPELINETRVLFQSLATQDAQQFGSQYSEFQNTPLQILKDTLHLARTEKRAFIQQNFEQKLIPLLTTQDNVAFEEIFENFCNVADVFLAE